MDRRELHGLRYACIEGCGFCCTFTPEASAPELAKLKTRFPQLPITRTGEMVLLAPQGGCGACTLLKNKRCTAYEDRPAHCRYFPFHVYFGRRTEVYVNRCCRGVEVAAGGNLQREFDDQVSRVAPAYRLQKGQERADTVNRMFEKAARESGMWGDVDREIKTNLERGARWFQPASWPPTPTGSAEEAGSPSEAWALALAPLAAEDPMVRPYHLAADLTWFGFRMQGDEVVAETLTEDGRLVPHKALGKFPAWPKLPPEVQEGLHAIMVRLATRDLLAGAIHYFVDDTGYEVSVADATGIKLGDIAADLALRADILHRMGIPWTDVPAEAERFYDSAFLDLPTIGGWL
ncbi:MAG: YkgJ family cysteine cluster protein [Candidatus Thermoplasmatota archaeon]